MLMDWTAVLMFMFIGGVLALYIEHDLYRRMSKRRKRRR